MLLSIAALVWGVGIALGSLYAIQFETTAGNTRVARSQWPAGSQCLLSSRLPTLVMFVHPRCGCSRASLSELSVLMTRCQSLVEVQVVFLQPSSSPVSWSQTDLWERAAQIPGVTVRQDIGGLEHRLFNASVSGEAFLFSPGGVLAFHGGMTASRGHEGDNKGRMAIESLVRNQVSRVQTAPVYGCDLEQRLVVSTKSSFGDDKGKKE